MADLRSKFSSLPNGVWEVVGFGRACAPSNSRNSETRVEVMLAQPDANELFPTNCRIERRWIGCGALMDRPIGSRWVTDKRQAPRHALPSEATVACRGAITYISRPTRTDVYEYFPATFGVPAPYYSVVIKGDESTLVIVPVVEVIRAVFGVTPRFLLQLFDGIRRLPLGANRPCFDRERSQLDGSTFRLSCETSCDPREELLAARILADPTLRSAHDNVSRYLATQRSKNAGGAWSIGMQWPFSEPMRWRFESRRIHVHLSGRGECDAMLITRIAGLSWKQAFRRLEVLRPAAAIDPGLPLRRGRLKVGHASAVELDPDLAPGFGRSHARILRAEVEDFGSDDVEIVALPASKPQTTGPIKKVGGRADGNVGSTGDKVPGGSDIVPADAAPSKSNQTATVNAPSARNEELRCTAAAVRLLAQDRRWSILFGKSGDPPTLPATIDGRRIGILFMEMHTDDRSVMIVDIGTLGGRSHALGLVARRDRRPMSADVDVILRFVEAERGGWSGRVHSDFVIGSLVRRTGLRDELEAYAAQIGNAIDRLPA